MNQWFDDALVAIDFLKNGTYKVLELPPRHDGIIVSRKTFRYYSQAEQYISDQYPHATLFSVEDFREEAAHRTVVIAAFPKDE